MADKGYGSGSWQVREGCEDAFVRRWEEFLGWTRENAEGFEGARLVRHDGHPRHYLSFGTWRDSAAVAGWMALPGFEERLKGCTDLCEDFHGGMFEAVRVIEASAAGVG